MSDPISRCPLCSSARIVSVVGPTRRAFCTWCGARWEYRGAAARPTEVSPGALQRVPRLSDTTERPSAS